jgi:predicted nucleic acid-binding protein
VAEDGSALAADLWDSPHAAASSILAYPEGRAALAAGRRLGRLTPAGYREAIEDFEATYDELLVVGVNEDVARRAGTLAEELDLRGYDAVHLASALALGSATTFITWDVDLSAAAHESGLAVAPSP